LQTVLTGSRRDVRHLRHVGDANRMGWASARVCGFLGAMSAFDLEEFLPYQLAVLAERTSRAFEAEYRARFGIGVAEWRVLAHLSQSPSVSVRDIQKQVAMEKSRVSRAASRLEASGFILRRPDPGDGRLIALELTAKGRDLIATMAPVAAAFEAEMMERLGDDGDAFRRALLALLSDD